MKDKIKNVLGIVWIAFLALDTVALGYVSYFLYRLAWELMTL